ncbi:Uncharacterised protein g7717 [Pycnogonum litorale]
MASQQMHELEINLERIRRLNKQVEQMITENRQMNMDVDKLVDRFKNRVSKLKDEIGNHERNGCQSSVLSSSAKEEEVKVEHREKGVAEDSLDDFPEQYIYSYGATICGDRIRDPSITSRR